ncbi:MAG: TetR/AcrR family transcriptional regulator [Deltaproteobacteria bacterium]|nr:MAG: TetR/AcrR family transcriptional regulator [Deltaproteobacteria bacterium]
MTTRAETKARTRQALIDAGRALVNEQGFDAPSLDKICKRAGFTRGAFYVHFEDREDFLAAVAESILADYTAIIVRTSPGSGDLERSIRQFVRSIGSVGDDARLAVLLDGCARSTKVRARTVAAVMAAIELLRTVAEGEVREDLDPRAIAELLVAAVFGTVAVRQLGLDVNVDHAADAVIAMLRPAP